VHQNTWCYFNSALQLFLPVEEIEGILGFKLKLGKKNYFFRGFDHPFNSIVSAGIATNKSCTHCLLSQAGIPVPKSVSISVDEYEAGELETLIKPLCFPLVAKPLAFTGLGRDVCCNIKTIEALKVYLELTLPLHNKMYIEEFHGGMQSYRILVFKGKVLGVIHRIKAAVVGDGKHHIESLIGLENEKRMTSGLTALGPILIDSECYTRLEEQSLSLDHIPPAGKIIFLNYTSNSSRGGTFEALPVSVLCQENVKMMIRIAQLMNLDLAGIDVECSDLGIPIRAGAGVVIEVNHSPSVRIHEVPLKGKSIQVSKKMIWTLIRRHPIAYIKILLRRFF
jgi:D-alanine-D-alanine ligase-like ATP-grasp enzyme